MFVNQITRNVANHCIKFIVKLSSFRKHFCRNIFCENHNFFCTYFLFLTQKKALIFLVCFYRGCRLGRRVVAFCSPGALRKLDLINFLCLCIIIVWRQNKPTLLISGDLCLLHVIGKYIKDIYIITA